MAKTFDGSQILTNLEGEPLQFDERDLTLGKAISAIVLQSKNEDKIMSYELAKKWYKEGKTTEVSSQQLNFTRDEVKMSTAFLPIVSGQVLLLLE